MFYDPRDPDRPIMDAVDLVVEAANLVSIYAADRVRRIDAMRREALQDAARAGRVLTDVVERGIRLELAAALRVTERAADTMLRLSEALVHRYPSVLQALGRADITEKHAEVLVEEVDRVEPAQREGLIEPALAEAKTKAVGAFRRAVRRLVEETIQVTAAERHRQAVTERRVVIEPAEDGMSWLHAYLPSVEAHAIHGRVTAIAKVLVAADAAASEAAREDAREDARAAAPSGEEGVKAVEVPGAHAVRTLDQARADVLGDLLIEGIAPVHPDDARGIRATVAVTVPALALLTENDAERDAAGLAPATVEGIGPIPLQKAKELCGGADGWMRVLTHPETGAVLSVGRSQYRPPQMLRKLVRWRAERCMAPGCGIPASRCEIDHTIAWEHGGTTSLHNLTPLCKGHHTVKHHGGWNVKQIPDSGGALEWTSPTGRHYIVQPERRTPVFRHTDGEDDKAPF